MKRQPKRTSHEIEQAIKEQKERHAATRKVNGDNYIDGNGIEWHWSRGLERFVTLPGC